MVAGVVGIVRHEGGIFDEGGSEIARAEDDEMHRVVGIEGNGTVVQTGHAA